MDEFLNDEDIRLISNKPPRHVDFIKILDMKTGEDIGSTNEIHLLNLYGKKKISSNTYILYNNRVGIFDDKGFFKANEPLEFDKSQPSFIMVFNEEQYKTAEADWKGYFDWKKNRNVKRSILEEKYGYDTKHASHLIRLMWMANFILSEKKVYVKLPEPYIQTIKDIRNGKYTYDQIIEMSNSIQKTNETLYELSDLRNNIDKKWAKELYCKLVLKHLHLKGPFIYERLIL